jgi:hypothetical protein
LVAHSRRIRSDLHSLLFPTASEFLVALRCSNIDSSFLQLCGFVFTTSLSRLAKPCAIFEFPADLADLHARAQLNLGKFSLAFNVIADS